ncbi:MAG: ribonuclease HII [Candidatus Aenigmatarchaeota archaeon]|nr:MAG: ribonuclease HII [Candidatus Aenigmarchaeota archaeon]
MGLLLGIDEAGKGPVIGPLIIAGVIISEENSRKLGELGVKDSKELSPKKRQELFSKIKELSEDFIILETSSKQLNEEMEMENLNTIEIKKMGEIIDSFEGKNPEVFIDAIEANTLKFKDKIISHLKNKKLKIVAENRADQTYPVVSAASILAKVTRDSKIKKLHDKYGFFGSGYPADGRTIKFLEELNEENYNEIVRLKWSTSKRILEKKKQKGLGEF